MAINPFLSFDGKLDTVTLAPSQLDQLAELADCTAAAVEEAAERVPTGAVRDQLVSDIAYAQGVRDALLWLENLTPELNPTRRLTQLLELHKGPTTEPLQRTVSVTARQTPNRIIVEDDDGIQSAQYPRPLDYLSAVKRFAAERLGMPVFDVRQTGGSTFTVTSVSR